MIHLAGARLITGRANEVLLDHVVSLDGERITAVRPRGALPSGTDVIEYGDVTVLPGLIDAHQHLSFDASDDVVARIQTDDDATLLQSMRTHALEALAVGITTIRDLGDRDYLSLALRDRILGGQEIGPRIVASGPPITTRNGHCWFLGGTIEGPWGIRDAVRAHVARGVDVIKVMASGGVLTPTTPPHESQLGRSELGIAADEAHAAGLPLAVHAHGARAIADSLAIGADSIEHCTFFSADGVDADPTILEELAASACVVSATAAALPGGEIPHEAVRTRIDAVVEIHRRLFRNGARIVCSSDAGIARTKPHSVLPHGVTTFLTGIGMTNAEAITNVTAFAAEVCAVADRTGTLEAGKDADILVVNGNPLDDITAIHDVVAVYARGRRAPSSIQQGLATT